MMKDQVEKKDEYEKVAEVVERKNVFWIKIN